MKLFLKRKREQVMIVEEWEGQSDEGKGSRG